ncbi:CrcB family protein [Rhodococcus sp. HM1]|uniref:fluoride efflux transporter FluC n=1 Tax=unclassified Rhodococcus (in: high G+C Gram-positive bacteria) TaxID=192944 RepID=UPI0018CDFB7F|nr:MULTISPECIES: CrcB family protein [unclassified Rhodococcus (in: high G+C Gram-positive bacteria)]MBH0121899.1 CrcB family protein [Rhodococcus sp. CX]MCK8670315.1 CrcB family protein [Rhodococcus sp. HM1]
MAVQARAVAVVAAGGALGAVARYGLSTAFPGVWTIAAINIAGSLLLGILAAMVGPDRLLRLFLGIGVLGGFTTFSTFAVDAVRNPAVAVAYVAITLTGALIAARCGMAIGERLHRRRAAR